MISTVPELIRLAGGPSRLADILGFQGKSGTSLVSVWNTRGHIPARYADHLRSQIAESIDGRVFDMYEVDDGR